MQRFLSFWASYSITWPRCKRSFVSNNWCLVWTRSAFPQSFLSCKQSDAERKDFADILEQGHSWFYTSLRLFVSFVEEIASPTWGWREGGLSSHQGVCTRGEWKLLFKVCNACLRRHLWSYHRGWLRRVELKTFRVGVRVKVKKVGKGGGGKRKAWTWVLRKKTVIQRRSNHFSIYLWSGQSHGSGLYWIDPNGGLTKGLLRHGNWAWRLDPCCHQGIPRLPLHQDCFLISGRCN